MSWLRNLLLPVLLLALIAGAYAASVNVTFGKPDNVKQWLHESNVYDHLINYGVEQASKSSNNGQEASSVTSDPQVIEIVKTSFPPSLLESSVNAFLDGNYDWLQGKTEKPEFSVDLTQAKQNLANGLSQYAGQRFLGLPPCTAADLSQYQGMENTDWLSLTCQPPGVSQQAVIDEVSREILNGNLLENTTVTPDTISRNLKNGADGAAQSSPQGGQPAEQSKPDPYYQTFSMAPALYKFGMITPWIALLAALLSAVGIVFWSATKRKGFKLTGIMLTAAGLWLLISKFMFDASFDSLEQKITSTNASGQLQKAVTDVAHNAEQMLTKVDMWFGLAYLLIAVAIFAYLFMTREQNPSAPAMAEEKPSAPAPAPPERPKLRKPPKPPRLIQ